jgi:hypothetical protein
MLPPTLGARAVLYLTHGRDSVHLSTFTQTQISGLEFEKFRPAKAVARNDLEQPISIRFRSSKKSVTKHCLGALNKASPNSS